MLLCCNETSMAPTRTQSARRRAKPPTGYNHKHQKDGNSIGAQFRENYKGVHDSAEPYHPRGRRVADPRGPGLTLKDLELVKALGRGSNGSVLLVRTRQSASLPGKLFALKAVSKKTLRQREDSTIPNDNSRERTALVALGWNAFICGLLETFHDDRNVYMMLEYSPCGSFDLLIDQEGPLPSGDALFYFANIVCGLEHMEKCGYVHRDLKPLNLLVGPDGYLMICDFGTAMPVPKDGELVDPAWWGNEGTPVFQAPESFEATDVRYGPAIDWWAAGITLFEMMTLQVPYEPSGRGRRGASTSLGDDVLALIRDGPYVWPPQFRVGRKLKDLVACLLLVNADERLGARGAAEVMAHPWLASVDWARMRRKWYLPPGRDFVAPPAADLRSFRKPVKKSWYPGLHFPDS
ncbi:Protein kinase domain-containing protein [Mycena chlorophos]|uniref:cAMP-dependent protein kinase n=1 Tax=Mycena chlorophos TaxID=658473 RepID=A0A8H6TSE1_MYCCL|nr:Protein kinase domain-containing protein [Mycena chlorophos]